MKTLILTVRQHLLNKQMLLPIFLCSVFLSFASAMHNAEITIEYPLYSDTTQPVEFDVLVSNLTTNKLAYQFDWGNGEISDWSDWRNIYFGFSHSYLYKNPGVYLCKVRVKDEQNNISEWSQPCAITIIPNLLKWQYQSNSGIYSAPSIGPTQEIYLACEDGSIHCLNPDGTLLWHVPLYSSIYSSPVIGKKAIYVTTTAGTLHALDFKGQEKWRFETNSTCYTTPALDIKEVVYFGCDDGKLYCVSDKGKQLWQYQTGDEISGSPVISKQGTIYIASDAIYALNQKGNSQWIFRPAEDEDVYYFASPVLGNDGTIYIGATDGALYAITDKGRLKWQAFTEEEDEIRSGAVVDQQDNVYFGDENGVVHVKKPFAQVTPLFETDYYIFSSPALDANGNIYVVSDDGFLYCLNEQGKLMFKWEIAEDSKDIMYSPSPIIDQHGTVYVASWEGKLFAFNGFAPAMKNTWSLYRYNQQNTGYKSK
ncbi:MAG: PQQ-binding-like beta-propeller repeat protein [Candidatus Latescibacteria bacterium]|nr:PQQ-binding-like beta-propeller repeat protein [Candidatus Latescibacterota bacterium]